MKMTKGDDWKEYAARAAKFWNTDDVYSDKTGLIKKAEGITDAVEEFSDTIGKELESVFMEGVVSALEEISRAADDEWAMEIWYMEGAHRVVFSPTTNGPHLYVGLRELLLDGFSETLRDWGTDAVRDFSRMLREVADLYDRAIPGDDDPHLARGS